MGEDSVKQVKKKKRRKKKRTILFYNLSILSPEFIKINNQTCPALVDHLLHNIPIMEILCVREKDTKEIITTSCPERRDKKRLQTRTQRGCKRGHNTNLTE
jgi:hypothetical protein